MSGQVTIKKVVKIINFKQNENGLTGINNRYVTEGFRILNVPRNKTNLGRTTICFAIMTKG